MLDEFNEKSIIENIFNNYKSKKIIFISHNLDLLDYCEIKYEIRNKQIIQLKIKVILPFISIFFIILINLIVIFKINIFYRFTSFVHLQIKLFII